MHPYGSIDTTAALKKLRFILSVRELPNQEKIWTSWEKETYKYLGILEADTFKHVEIKEKN